MNVQALGIEPPKVGLRDRNSPMCTSSQLAAVARRAPAGPRCGEACVCLCDAAPGPGAG